MRISRVTSRHGNVLPEALGVIAALPDSVLHHVTHGRRHPASLYARSLAQVAQAWHAALDKIENFDNSFVWTQDDTALPDVIASYRQLLFSLYEHLDASYGCVRALVPCRSNNDPLLDTQFLDRANVPGWQNFRSLIRPYTQNRIGAAVNSLKHNQAEILSFYLHNLPDLRVGYYIRDVQKSGALGPSLRVHHDGNSAFSFGRDMLIHFWNLYLIGSELSKVVRQIVPTESVKEPERYESGTLNSTYADLAKRLSNVPLAFFQDEARLPCPLVRWNPAAEELGIDMPGPIRPRKLPSSYQMRAALTVDMAHASNKLPYFGKNAA